MEENFNCRALKQLIKFLREKANLLESRLQDEQWVSLIEQKDAIDMVVMLFWFMQDEFIHGKKFNKF